MGSLIQGLTEENYTEEGDDDAGTDVKKLKPDSDKPVSVAHVCRYSTPH